MKKQERIKKILKNQIGFSGYIEAAVAIFLICMVLSIGLNIIPAFLLKNDLDNYAEKALRRIELSGNTNDDTIRTIEEIAEKYNLKPTIEIVCNYINGTNHIQIDTEIVFTAKQDYVVQLGLLGSYTIPLYGKATGYSEVYFK